MLLRKTRRKGSNRDFEKKDAIFQGEVVSVSEPFTEELINSKGIKYGNWQYLYLDFRVIKVWKGAESKTVRVILSMGINCDFGKTKFKSSQLEMIKFMRLLWPSMPSS